LSTNEHGSLIGPQQLGAALRIDFLQVLALPPEMERFKLRSEFHGKPALRRVPERLIVQQFQLRKGLPKVGRHFIGRRHRGGEQLEHFVLHAAVGSFGPHFDAGIQAARQLNGQGLAHRWPSEGMDRFY
jgi:hypothetical protein